MLNPGLFMRARVRVRLRAFSVFLAQGSFNMEISDLKTNEDLCEFLEIELRVFEDLCRNRDLFIVSGFIPKRGGGYRMVHAVKNDAFKNFLKSLKSRLEPLAEFPECVQGFVKKRSIFTNASFHLDKRVVINADIKNFFETIKIDRVEGIFKRMGFSALHANVLARLVTVGGSLAVGFSTSPILSNLVCKDMDSDFLKLAQDYNAVYTRYGDDISLSGNTEAPSKAEIEEIFTKHKFRMNDKKFKIQRKGGSQYVTGLTVCDLKQPHMPRRLKRRLRLEIYYIKKFGEINHGLYLLEHLMSPRIIGSNLPAGYSVPGWIHYSSLVDSNFAKWLRRMWPTYDALREEI